MNESERTRTAPKAWLKRLLCRRTGEQVALQEHASCPYCFGRLADIEKGRHEAFCDYRPDEDAVSFGFPSGASRDVHG